MKFKKSILKFKYKDLVEQRTNRASLEIQVYTLPKDYDGGFLHLGLRDGGSFAGEMDMPITLEKLDQLIAILQEQRKNLKTAST